MVPLLFELKKAEVCLLRSDLTLAMPVVVTQATTGNTLFDQTHSYPSHFRIWELRKHLCETLQCTPYFSWFIFHQLQVVDDCAFVTDLA